jgi:hypothetical protein
MSVKIRQRWDSVNDCPSNARLPFADQQRAFREAVDRPIPLYRAKLVTLPHGQSEISVTPVNTDSLIDARMGFNALLDCSRKQRTSEEQDRRDIENRARATKKARQSVRFLVKSIAADHMLTFSYRDNVVDRLKVADDWNRFKRLFRKRYPEWQYVTVREAQERGSFHLHVAVSGRQDIKWLLRCWLIAIGQSREDVASWLLDGVKLADRSLGAVNVRAPKGGNNKQWKRDKLAGYLTKYIGKEFEESDKYAKKYWHSDNCVKPIIERFWLRAKTYAEAVVEAHDHIFYTGATSLSMWGDHAAGVVWITGETDRQHIGQCTQGDISDFYVI